MFVLHLWSETNCKITMTFFLQIFLNLIASLRKIGTVNSLRHQLMIFVIMWIIILNNTKHCFAFQVTPIEKEDGFKVALPWWKQPKFLTCPYCQFYVKGLWLLQCPSKVVSNCTPQLKKLEQRNYKNIVLNLSLGKNSYYYLIYKTLLKYQFWKK